MALQPFFDVRLLLARQLNVTIAERIGIDKTVTNARFDFFIVPAHGDTGGDNGAHRRAGKEINRHIALAQRLDRANMGVGACAAARENKRDGAPCNGAGREALFR
ncbi:MAG: hypothetical protein R3C60_05465 [Parvularculaceae bacterium]